LLILVLQTVIYYRQAGIMEKQVYISRESNELTKATQRAFINALPIKIEDVKDQGGLIWSWNVSPQIENSGNTAAYNVQVETGMSHWIPESHPGEERPDFPPELTPDNPTYRKTTVVLGPHGKTRLMPFGLSNPKAADAIAGQHINSANISSGNWSMFAQGIINYDDAFGRHHITKICFVFTGWPTVDEVYGISWAQCGGNSNCIDDECLK
jgi:hypothetical protein